MVCLEYNIFQMDKKKYSVLNLAFFCYVMFGLELFNWILCDCISTTGLFANWLWGLSYCKYKKLELFWLVTYAIACVSINRLYEQNL